MALQEGRITVRLVGGVDTKTDPKAVVSARLLDLQNGVFARGGSIRKRNGFASLGRGVDGTAARYANARSLAVRDDELLLLCDGQSYSYRPSSDSWSAIGPAPSVTVTEAPIGRTGTAQTAGDHATSGGVTVAAWEDSASGIWWCAIEDGTGRMLRQPAQLDANGQRPRCCAVGSVLHVYYCNPATGIVYVAVVNPAAPLDPVSPLPLVIDLSTSIPSYDAEPTFGAYDASNPAVIAWAAATGGYRVGYVNASGALGSVGNGLPSVASWPDAQGGAIAVAFDRVSGSGIAVLWSSSATPASQTPRWRLHSQADPTVSLQSGALSSDTDAGGWPRITAAFGAASGGDPQLWWAGELDGASDPNVARVYSGSVDAATGAIAAPTICRGHGLAARAMQSGGRVYLLLARQAKASGSLFCYYALVDAVAGIAAPQVCAARILPGVATGLPTRGHLPSSQPDGNDAAATVHHVLVPYHAQVPGQPGQFAETALERATFDFDDGDGWQAAQLGRCLYLGGGLLRQYDGRRWAEAGFHDAPEPAVPATDDDAGALTPAGTYGWIFTYEETNAQGEVDRSTVCAAVTKTLGGGDTEAVFQIPTCRLTGRANVRIAAWRSLNGDASAYYRVSSLDPATAGSDNGYIENIATQDTTTFIDGMADGVAKLQEQLYTDGGVLPNDPPPSGRALAAGKNRLFFSDPADPDLVRYSQQLEDGYGVDLADALAIRIPPYGGAVVSVQVMDDAAIVLKETALYYFGGPGPNANPDSDASAGFSDPALITSDVGCARPESVVSTPIGIMFQTAKGIYLLGRDRQVSYVGAPVEAYNDLAVRGAVLLPDRTQVLFVCDSGRTLLYDYFFQQWSTFTLTGLSAVVAGGLAHVLRGDGRVSRETIGSYSDDGSHVPLQIETAWLRLSDALQGFQLVWHLYTLGTRASAHQLRLQYALDYNDLMSAPITIDARTTDGTPYGGGPYGAGPYGGGGESAYQWRFHLCEPCQAIRFRFVDVEDTGAFGASYELTELLVTGGVKGTAIRPMPANRSA